MLPTQLLWDPLPDRLPVDSSRPLGGFRDKVAVLLGFTAASRLPLDELIRRRVRRGAVQGLVRDAYQTTIADQDGEHRRPREFARAWQSHLAALLDHSGIDLSGCGSATLTGEDIDLAWELYETASRARQDALDHVKLKHRRCPEFGNGKVPIFELATISQGDELGKAKYGTCYPCGIGLLYKISFDPDWQFCGLGRLVLSEIEDRHPRLTWYTTAQFKEARGFYDRYRQNSKSPWSDKQHPCLHFD